MPYATVKTMVGESIQLNMPTGSNQFDLIQKLKEFLTPPFRLYIKGNEEYILHYQSYPLINDQDIFFALPYNLSLEDQFCGRNGDTYLMGAITSHNDKRVLALLSDGHDPHINGRKNPSKNAVTIAIREEYKSREGNSFSNSSAKRVLKIICENINYEYTDGEQLRLSCCTLPQNPDKLSIQDQYIIDERRYKFDKYKGPGSTRLMEAVRSGSLHEVHDLLIAGHDPHLSHRTYYKENAVTKALEIVEQYCSGREYYLIDAKKILKTICENIRYIYTDIEQFECTNQGLTLPNKPKCRSIGINLHGKSCSLSCCY